MLFQRTSAGDTAEILAADDFDAVPFTVTETTAVKAGTPMTLAGKKAAFTAGTDGAAGTTTADGILLYDTDPAENPSAALVVRGIIDRKKAQTHSGVTYDAAALKAAVPGIILRDNIGVNVPDTV